MSSSLESLARVRVSNTDASTTLATPPSRWKTRVLAPLVLLALVALALAFAARDRLLPATEVRVAPVVLKTVEGSVASAVVQAAGWVEPDPSPVYVSALTAGVIEEVLVLEGEPVTRGQVVARLIRDDALLALEQAQAELALAEARREDRQARQEAAVETLEQLVDRRELEERARAELEAAEAELALAGASIAQAMAVRDEIAIELSRRRPLAADEIVPALDLERLEQRLAAQEAEVEVARALQRRAAARRAENDARVRAAGRHLELLIDERLAVRTAEAALEEAQAECRRMLSRAAEARLRLDRTEIRAPSDGVVMTRLVSPGSRVTPAGGPHEGHVAHLYDPRSLQVRVDVPLADAALVGVGQEAEIAVEVLPEHRFQGRVSRLVHQADVQKNTLEVKVAIHAPTAELKPEMLARVRFLVAERRENGASPAPRQRLFAPRRLVGATPGAETSLFVVVDLTGDRGRAERRTVAVGVAQHQDHVEIVSGLRPGDRIIVDPPAALAPGARVRVMGDALAPEGR